MDTISIIRPQGLYLSRDKDTIYDIAGRPSREISLAPPLLITQVMRELQSAPTQSQQNRLAAIARAGELFAHATLEGENPQDYCQSYAQISGVPIAVAQRSLEVMRHTMQELATEIALQQPQGAANSAMQLRTLDAAAVWLPRGKTLSVIAPSNHPMIHVSWLQALAFGYHVAVRPGRRDPFTPLRLIRSLLTAGLAPGHIAFLPSYHSCVECMVEAADFAIVYGNESAVTRYAGKANVLVRGPGHSKLLVERVTELEEAGGIGTLLEAVAADGGVRCTNASALLIGENVMQVATKLAEQLSRLPVLAATDPAACLPVMPFERASDIRAMMEACLGDAVDLCRLCTPDEPVVNLGNGTAVLRPAVLLCRTTEHPAFGTEFPFPCVWVASWIPQHGVNPLRNSLVVTMITENETLVRDALCEQSIRKVCWGPISPCFSVPGVPHDGYIGQFLMEVKGLVRTGVK